MLLQDATVPLVLLSLALLISVCLNVIFFLRQRSTFCKNTCCHTNASERDFLSQVQRQYDSDVNHREEQESPRNHHERQENPIYGNINTDRRGSAEDCYEMMTLQRTRESTKPSESDLNYASLNLKMAKKRKKHRHTQGQAQGRNKHQDQKPDHGTPPVNSFLELDADVDAHLPPRDISTMISYNSIYLNSQQIAQEAVELERERTMNMGMDILGWEGINQCDDDEGRRWEEGQHSEERKDDGSDGNACVLHIEAETSADAE
ncbi:uncharacterized protein [Nothobranchius furzeri]|uniref:LOC107386967-like protein n=1 Tax=Nothobranchius furzeri TaxID=105023 RepID=A0A1A7ZAX0_NOTFU|nr:uncharacterized protein LOC107386967 isoform X3 [Nothobranchius furzeri]KAF7206517.1 putative LOC107386967-like protein [Nothobranchius furzeri]